MELTGIGMKRVFKALSPIFQRKVLTDPKDLLLGNLVRLRNPHLLIEIAGGGSVRGFLALSNQVIEEIEVRQETKKQEEFMRMTTMKAGGFINRSTLKDSEKQKS
jgi:hypothetical protein